jgi:tetratricopeptide (TPR) repeat protein
VAEQQKPNNVGAVRQRMRPFIIAGAIITVAAALVIRQNLTKPTTGLVLTSAQITDIEAATAAVKANPNDTSAHWKLVALLESVGNDAALATEYITLIRLEPEKPDAIIGMGELLLKAGRYDEAQDAFTQATVKFPTSPMAWNGLGATLYAQKNYRQAVTTLRTAIKLAPDDTELQGVLGSALMEQVMQFPDRGSYKRELAEARLLLEKHLPQTNLRGEVLYRLGRIANIQRDNKSAVDYLTRAQEELPDKSAIAFALATAYIGQGRREEGRRVVEAALVKFPNEAALFDLLGQLHQRSGKPNGMTEARNAFSRAIALKPDIGSYQERYGVACLRANDLETALAAFVTASKLSPHKAFPYQQLALIFNRLGRTQDARDASKIAQDIAHDENLLKQAQNLSMVQPKNIGLLLVLGDRYRDLGLKAPAKLQYERILELKPGHPEATKGLQLLGPIDEPQTP